MHSFETYTMVFHAKSKIMTEGPWASMHKSRFIWPEASGLTQTTICEGKRQLFSAMYNSRLETG